MISNKKHTCFVATIPDVVYAFLKDHINASAEQWPVTVISNPKNAKLLIDLNSRFIPLDIQRKVSPWYDLLALFNLIGLFRRERFDLVHSIMPKTGLLTMLAAKLAGVPVRIHTFTGQVWANKQGWKRAVLKKFDKLIVSFATHILVDSPSQRAFLIEEGVLPPAKGQVIGNGSICGVDRHRFHPDEQTRTNVRKELGIDPNAKVILFLGRLNRDKGMLDLAAAFADIASRRSDTALVLVGAEEDVPYTQIQTLCGQYRDRLHRVSFTPNPERYMAAADIFCLPSYREGFGQVVIEAAACGVPTVATRIYGITDAVEENLSGLLFPPGNVAELTDNLLKLIDDYELCINMGDAAKMRAIDLFSSEQVTAKQIAHYEEVLA